MHVLTRLAFFGEAYATLKSALLVGVYVAVFSLTPPELQQRAEHQPYPDPIHGHIALPIWLVEVLREKTVRRMLFIRQLGLKAYIDFPGAIHTRYSHSLGTMHLAGKVADLLVRKERIAGNENIARTLEQNHTNLMAAGFFHDLGHGPFSHAVDFVMKKLTGKTHEDISAALLDATDISSIEHFGVTIGSVKQIITAKHDFPFLNGIVNGPLDVDKLDYLLRDSYHVGLRYSFDLDHFIETFRVLGDQTELEECELGLEYNAEARTTTEIFLIIWKSMYELVYNKERSRVAEKMLEKAILIATQNENGSELKSYFTEIGKYAELHDEMLLEKLKNAGEQACTLVKMIESGSVFSILVDDELASTESLDLSELFLDELVKKDEAEVAEDLTELLTSKLGCEKYDVICDIIKGKVPHTIHMDKKVEEEPLELKQDSEVVRALVGKNRIRVYSKPGLNLDAETVRRHLNEALTSWK